MIEWTTDIPAYHRVRYRETGTEDWTVTDWDMTLDTSASITLTGLAGSTEYDYQVQSFVDNSAAFDWSPDPADTFTTCVIPVVSNLDNTPGITTCVITWDTDVAADQQVRYRKDGEGEWSYEPESAEGSSTSHEVTLTGLDAEHELYQFYVISSQGNCTGSWYPVDGDTFYTTCAAPTQSDQCAEWHMFFGNLFKVTTPTACKVRVRYRRLGMGDEWTACDWEVNYGAGVHYIRTCSETDASTTYEYQFQLKNKCDVGTAYSNSFNVTTDGSNRFISTC